MTSFSLGILSHGIYKDDIRMSLKCCNCSSLTPLAMKQLPILHLFKYPWETQNLQLLTSRDALPNTLSEDECQHFLWYLHILPLLTGYSESHFSSLFGSIHLYFGTVLYCKQVPIKKPLPELNAGTKIHNCLFTQICINTLSS